MHVSERLIEKAKNAILSDIRKCIPGTGELEIKVEAHGGVEHFQTALQLPEVQSALRQKNITAVINVINPLSIVMEHILSNIRKAPHGTIVTFQALEEV